MKLEHFSTSNYISYELLYFGNFCVIDCSNEEILININKCEKKWEQNFFVNDVLENNQLYCVIW